MAPMADAPAVTLAPLDKHIVQGHRLVSWEIVYQALSSLDLARQSSSLQHIFSPDVIQLLSKPFAEPAPPSSQTKAAFDQWFSSSTIPPESQAVVDQLKEDALWLSQQTKTDEHTALGTAVLQWQNTPASRILQGYTPEERISLQKATNTTDFGASLAPKQAEVTGAGNGFDSQAKRRIRLLETHLSQRQYLLEVATLVAGSSMHAPVEPEGRSYGAGKQKDEAELLWLPAIAASIEETQQQGKANVTGVTAMVAAVEARLRGLETGSGWVVDEEDISAFEDVFRQNQMAEIVRILQLLLIDMSSVASPLPAAEVRTWFEFVDKYGFFERFQLPSPELQTHVGTIQALVCVLTLQLLKLPYTLDYFDFPATRGEDHPAPIDRACLAVVNEVLLSAAKHGSSIASPALLAWSIILQRLREVTQNALGEADTDEDTLFDDTPTKPRRRRRSSHASLPTAFADALEQTLKLDVEEDPMQFFAKSAVGAGNAFSVVAQLSSMLKTTVSIAWTTKSELHARICLLEWIRQALLFTNYSSEVVDVTLAVLQVDESSDKQVSGSIRAALIQAFVRDDAVLIPQLLYQAQSRYPYETTPFLKLCKVLCPEQGAGKANLEALPLSEATSRFTQVMPRGFDGFELVREDEEANCIRLTVDLPLFSDRAATRGTKSALAETRQLQKSHVDSESFIPKGTIGYVISDSAPFVVMWEHQHSVLRYLGFLLSTVPATSSRKNLTLAEDLDKETQADIIDLLSALLDATIDTASEPGETDHGNARWVLEQASDALDRNADIIAVVSDIFEDEMGSQSLGREEGSTDLLCACIHFIHAVTKVVPSRIWPLLARSDFVAVGGRGGRMSIMLETSELAPGRYRVLKECVALYEALVADVLQHAVARRVPTVTAGRRFNQSSDVATGSPRKVLSKTLLSLTQTFVNIVLNSATDNPSTISTFMNLYSQIISTFTTMLSSVYQVDDQNKTEDKLASAFAPAAEFLVEVFLSSKNNFPTTALLSLCLSTSLSKTPKASPTTPDSTKLLHDTLTFFTTMLDAGVLLNLPSSYLEQQLFQSLPFLARVYVSREALKQPIVLLLSSLVTRAGSLDSEPKSLLGHLGPQTAKDFLTSLAALDQPVKTTELEASIWTLFSLVMSCRQQWFATYILTGDSPKNSLKKKDESATSSQKPILSLALDMITKTSSLNTPKAVSILVFVNAAQSYWPWITSKLRAHEDFLNRLLDYLGGLNNDAGRTAKEHSYQLAAAAQVADILALYLHNMRLMGDISFIKKLGPKLGYLRAHGVAIPQYNTSLHANLKRNFEKKFPGCTLTDFKRITSRPTFGNDYFYSITLADQLFGHDAAWSGPRSGFRDEIRRANENLSLVEAHIVLMTSWRSLAIELSQSLGQEKPLQKYLATTIHQCLIANTESTLTDPIFQTLITTRIDLALALLQRLVLAKSDVPTMRTLLSTTWDTIRACTPDFESAFSTSNTDYYRSLLRLLLLAVQPHTYISTSDPVTSLGEGSTDADTSSWSSDVMPLLLEITAQVVGKGFRNVTTLIHEDMSAVQPADFALINAILQTVLRVPGIESVHTQLTLRLCDTAAHRYAIALFSWSDRLTLPATSDARVEAEEDDPIFADLSLSFLHTLSTIPPMAEYLATEGILSQLSTAPLLTYLRSKPFGPTIQPLRMHHLWARSLLPLTLNVIFAVGASYAAEAAAWLNSFPLQLERAAGVLAAPNGGRICLGDALELGTIALLATVLGRYEGDPVALANGSGHSQNRDGAGAFELRHWDQAGRAAVKEDVEGWLRGSLEGRVVPVGEREVRLMRGKGTKEAESRLCEVVRGELRGVGECLGGGS